MIWKWSLSVVAAIALIAVGGTALSGRDGRIGMQDVKKWEYKLVELKRDKVDENTKALNTLGAEGWELTTVLQSGGLECYLVLKRPR